MGKVMNVIHFVDYDGGEVGGIKNLKKTVKGKDSDFSFASYFPIPRNIDDWYSWCIINWGSKWDVFEVSNFYKNKIAFKTADATPVLPILKLSKLFPSISIYVKFAEEQTLGNVGSYSIVNGEIFAEHIAKNIKETKELSKIVYHEAEEIYYSASSNYINQ